ncbi:MAG: 4Fe-4S binding protein [Thermodesulfobacteriota bacterium]
MREKANRKQIQYISAALVPVVIVGGHYWPYFGYIAIAMLALMMVLALFRGRYYCGWFCAMGSFHERLLALVSRKLSMPPVFKQAWFRWIVFVLMMSLLGTRLLLTEGEPARIGAVFVMMWTLATGLAVGVGLIWKPRSWCSICPMGTFQAMLAPRTYRLQVAASCKECGACQRACPIETYPGANRQLGVVASVECMRCGNCVVNCPSKALSFPRKSEGEAANSFRPDHSSQPV